MSRWLPEEPLMVISTACGTEHHDDCETPNCGCLCHEPGGSGSRHYDKE